MAGINSLLFLKVLCDLEREKMATIPDEEYIQEDSAPNDDLDESTKSVCFVKLYIQEKYGIGGSLGSKRYACHRCSCLFRRKRHLRVHLRFHCNHKCLGCSECYSNIHKSFKSVQGEDPGPLETFTCSLCPTSFQTQAGLAIHQECHPQPDKVLDCESCPQKFSNRWELDRHQKMHVTSVVHKCKYCSKAFSTSSNLGKHVRIRHQKYKMQPGDHFLAQFIDSLGSDMEHCDKLNEDNSDAEYFKDDSSKVCALCNQSFKYMQLNKTHVCPLFPALDNLDESVFQCPACSQTYSSLLALKMHCGAHTGVDPLTCLLCKKKFSNLRKANCHFEYHGRNTCNKCGVLFSTKLSLLLHHCGYTQRCFVCDEVFPTKISYRCHLQVHPLPKNVVFKCLECKKSFVKESYFRAHKIDHTGMHPFSCSVCNEKFLMYGPFKKHALIHITSQRLNCPSCTKTFRTTRMLKAHFESHKIKTESSVTPEDNPQIEVIESESTNAAMSGFECHHCCKVFRKQHQLFLHLRDTHEETPPYLFHCDLCSRGFYDKMHLNSHRSYCSQRNEEERKQVSEKMGRTSQSTFLERQFQCSECGRKYFTQYHLDTHMYVHRDSTDYPYQCDLCGVGYTREHFFKRHIEKCKGPDAKTAFKCKVCGATFQSEKSLDRHFKAHGKEWECSLCEEKFLTKTRYARHKTLCTPESAKYKTFRKPSKPPKIYTCPTCERTFQLRDRFEAHVAAHQGIIRFQCPKCFHRFMSTNNFKRHKCKFQGKAETDNDETCLQSRD